jgi:hypothetical protein
MRRPFSIWDYVVHFTLMVAQGCYLMAIEQGSIATTIVSDRNFVLGVWTIVYVALWASLLVMATRRALFRAVPTGNEAKRR